MGASLLREAALSFIEYLSGVWIQLYRSELPGSGPVMHSREDRELAAFVVRSRSIIRNIMEHERIEFEPH